ncbi:HAD-IA family hydrolase [Litorisediminicola beolgyonensis]|uniref:HAD-IA family hydrolase n=1 Tax=Litorisediminicola beolgyonensis TaxID=1173614 RepID=A0ABW3ZEA3_9RHOB
MTAPKLVIFDVDGTLVDSQADILAAMHMAFDSVSQRPPERAEILGIVGLSLPEALARLAPDLDAATRMGMVASYKDAYMTLRAEQGVDASSPLYPGVREVLSALAARDDLLLGVATGKSRRGLDKLLEGHGLETVFFTRQVSDDHPSKPHPSMLEAALDECGLEPSAAVMVGDTEFDMEMARAARIAGVGVSWGYHGRDRLSAATHVIDRIEDLPPVLAAQWGTA